MNTAIGIDKTASYRIYAACTAGAVAKAEGIHQSSNPAFGMVLTASGIMGLMLKSKGDRLSLIFKDINGEEIVATANALGFVKAYISRDDLSLKGGSLTVIKDLGLKEPYIGKTELKTGDVSRDLAEYFAVSEQQPSAVGLAPNGGLIVQVLPDAKEEVISALEEKLFMMDNIALLIEDSKNNPKKLTELIFGGEIKLLDERDITWRCDCSRERMKAALVSLGRRDLKEIIEEDGRAELTCQFCKSRYNFDKDELTEILENA